MVVQPWPTHDIRPIQQTHLSRFVINKYKRSMVSANKPLCLQINVTKIVSIYLHDVFCATLWSFLWFEKKCQKSKLIIFDLRVEDLVYSRWRTLIWLIWVSSKFLCNEVVDKQTRITFKNRFVAIMLFLNQTSLDQTISFVFWLSTPKPANQQMNVRWHIQRHCYELKDSPEPNWDLVIWVWRTFGVLYFSCMFHWEWYRFRLRTKYVC